MMPFINIFGRDFPTFGMIGILGIACAVLAAGFRAKRYKLSRVDVIYMSVFAGAFLMVGGTILFALLNLPDMWARRDMITTDFFRFVSRYFGGLVFYGGLVGAVFGLFAYAKYAKVAVKTVMPLAIPVLPLAHAVMRLGCFAAGCCYGIEAPAPFGIPFSNAIAAPNGVPLLPVQLYESAVNLGIFAVLWLFTKKDREWTSVLCLYGLTYAPARFLLEFLRGDVARGFLWVFSTSQIISIAIIFGCVVFLLYRRRKSSFVA